MSVTITNAEHSPVQKLASLTGLRFFAAILVVLFHFTGAVLYLIPSGVAAVLGGGYRMVSLFYVLSGFILVWNYRSATGEMKESSRDFWVARLARIYPAYFLSFLLAAPAVFEYARVAYTARTYWKVPVGGAAYLLMLQTWSPHLEAFWNFPGWSVSVEAFFYALFPLLLGTVGKLSKKHCVAAIGLCWLASILAYWLGHAARLETDCFPLLRLPEFVMGMLGALVVLDTRVPRLVSRLAAPICAVACVVVIGINRALPVPFQHGGTLAPVFLLLILALVYDRSRVSRLLGSKPLVVLGEASYGIYIFQWPVFFLMGLDVRTLTPVKVASYLVVLCALAILSDRFVEKPFRRAIRARFRPQPVRARVAVAA